MAADASAPLAGRVGVFGGAFDPPHVAHVALAQAALDQLGLTQLRIFPTGQAWHKARQLSAADHRLAMARLAFEVLPRTVVDGRELRRSGPTYTVDTLRELIVENPAAQPVLILGADQARAFSTWHGWEEILKIAIVSIADRADPAGAQVRFDPQIPPAWPAGARIESLDFDPIAMSATQVRALKAEGEDISQLVPLPVARYIDRHHLYTSPDDH